MRKHEALSSLQNYWMEIRNRFGVHGLFIFGSVARDEAKEKSDLDLVVDFDGPADFDRYMGLKFFLEDHLGIKVDLVTRKALRPELKSAIEQEAIRVA